MQQQKLKLILLRNDFGNRILAMEIATADQNFQNGGRSMKSLLRGRFHPQVQYCLEGVYTVSVGWDVGGQGLYFPKHFPLYCHLHSFLPFLLLLLLFTFPLPMPQSYHQLYQPFPQSSDLKNLVLHLIFNR